MKKECIKDFNPTRTEILYIGDELLFQREYYNSIHKEEFELTDSITNLDYRNICEELGHILYEKGIITKEELSPDVIKKIEESNYTVYKDRAKSNAVIEPSVHYFHIFYMFRLYGFLDDYDIFTLLKKYKILEGLEYLKYDGEFTVIPKKKEKLLKIIEKYKNECKYEYYTSSRKKVFDFNNKCFIVAKSYYIKEFCNIYNEENYQLFVARSIDLYQERSDRWRDYFVGLTKFINHIKKEYKKLSLLERKTKSLDLHKPSTFIDDLLNNDIEIITLETLIYILEDLNLTKTDIYFFANKLINEEPAKYDNHITRDYIENI